MSRKPAEGVLIEFIPLGDYVKVSAVDPVTGVEVSIVGDRSAGREVLERTAARKLAYVLSKRQDKPKPKSQSGWNF